jgi:Carbohydrate-binding module family 5/12
MSEPYWVALGSKIPIDYIGGWAPGVSYKAGDVVSYNGVDYLAVNPSTGVTPPPAPVGLTKFEYCILRHSVNQTLANGATSYLQWDIEESDPYNMKQADATRIYIPSTGVWRITVDIITSLHINGFNRLRLYHDQLAAVIAQDGTKDAPANSGGGENRMHMERTMVLTAGHSLYCDYYQNSGGAETLYGNRLDSPVLVAQKISAS